MCSPLCVYRLKADKNDKDHQPVQTYLPRVQTGFFRLVLSWGVADDRVGGRVDHGLVVDRWKVSVHQLELVLPNQDGPDGLDLNVGKALPNAAVPS